MVYRNGSLAYVTSVLGDEALVIVVDSGSALEPLDRFLDGKRTIVMNLGYSPVRIQGVEVAPAQAFIP